MRQRRRGRRRFGAGHFHLTPAGRVAPAATFSYFLVQSDIFTGTLHGGNVTTRKIEIEDGNASRRNARSPLFSVPSLVSLGLSICATAFSVGILAQKVAQNADAVLILQNRNGSMTPQAAQEIASLKAVSVAQQQQIIDLRVEMHDDRKEFIAAIRDLAEQFRQHTERTR